MQILRQKGKIKNNQIIIQVPEGFGAEDVDVIVLPSSQKTRQFKSISRIRIRTKDLKIHREMLHER